jgi:hypothetical protein
MTNPKVEHSLPVAFGLLVAMPPTQVWLGYVLSWLWQWFVVPLGVPAVSVWQAAGLVCLADLLRLRVSVTQAVNGDYAGRYVVAHGVAPLIMLALGWALHALMSGGR